MPFRYELQAEVCICWWKGGTEKFSVMFAAEMKEIFCVC